LRRASSKSEKFVAISHTKEAKENVKIIGNIKVVTKEEEIACKPFLLSVSRGAWTTCSGTAEVFFKEEEGCFSESQVALPDKRSIFGEASPPVSSMNLDDFHSKESLEAPPSIKAVSQLTLNSSSQKDVPNLSLKETTEGEGSWPSGIFPCVSTKGRSSARPSPLCTVLSKSSVNSGEALSLGEEG
jgi:hypothetical protein